MKAEWYIKREIERRRSDDRFETPGSAVAGEGAADPGTN